MQTVFESQSRSIDTEDSLKKNIAELGGADAVDSKFAAELVTGVRGGWEGLCAAVQEHAPEWPLDRMDTITRSILMIGAFEILHGKDARKRARSS
jgi:transcription termination factor NusB